MSVEISEKTIPQNMEAEVSILGALLLDNEAISLAVEQLKEEDFYKNSHRNIFAAIVELYDSNSSVDIVTLTEKLRKKGALEKIGGPMYITSLIESVSTSANIEQYIEIVKEKAILRKLITNSNDTIKSCYNEQEDINNLLDSVEKSIFNITQKRVNRDFVTIRDLVHQSIEHIDNTSRTKGATIGIPSGFKDFDALTSGFHQSDLVVVAARPSMGKTALALNMAEYMAVKEKKRVAIFSLEMASEQLVIRMLCSHARIDIHKVRSGFLGDDHYGKLVAAAGEMASSKIFVDDTAGGSLLELRAKARRLKSNYDIDIIFVDYLQLLQSSTRRNENRQQEISEISRSLKSLARELKIPIIVLSQLNRDVENRESHKPRLSDLRESGAIEQDADVVALLMRKEYYTPDDEPGIADVNIAKQRNGPVGEFKLTFTKECARFDPVSFYGEEA